MQPWNVRSGVNCPFCGKEMEMMSGTWYYEHNVPLVRIQCYTCDLTVYEHGSLHGIREVKANTYWPLVHALLKKVGGVQ